MSSPTARRSPSSSPSTSPSTGPSSSPSSGPPPTLAEELGSWVAAGLISEEQASAIEQHVASSRATSWQGGGHAGADPRTSLVVEALGYIGALVMVVGTGILVGIYWADLPVPLRLVLIGATAVALVGAGFTVPDRHDGVTTRLRAVLWAAGVVAIGAFMVVFSDEVLDLHDEDQVWLVGAATALPAAVLWWLRRTWGQQLALFVPLALTGAGTALQVWPDSDAAPGAAIWTLSVLGAALCWVGWIAPRTSGVSFAAAGATLGGLMMDDDLGIALALAAAVGAIALALLERERVWLGVGAVALLYTAPTAARAWFPGRLSAALTFIVTGGVLVGAAAWLVRHRGAERDSSSGVEH